LTDISRIELRASKEPTILDGDNGLDRHLRNLAEVTCLLNAEKAMARADLTYGVPVTLP
jgi:hypothetical protein